MCTSPRTCVSCAAGCSGRDADAASHARRRRHSRGQPAHPRLGRCPFPARQATRWARDLDLPRGGETVLYTGLMYQLIPYIERLVAIEQRLGNSPLARLTGLGRRRQPVRQRRGVRGPAIGPRTGRIRPDPGQRGAPPAAGRGPVRVPVRRRPVCRSADPRPRRGRRRSGARPARRRHDAQAWGSRGDHDRSPHDEHAAQRLSEARRRLRRARAKLPGGARRAERCPSRRLSPARSWSTIRACTRDTRTSSSRPGSSWRPRGSKSASRKSSGLLTWCCGGPVEALFPAKAAAVAASRVAQLREVAPDCVTMCPICLVNLRKSADGMRFRDISDYLVEASAPLPDRGHAGERRDPDRGVHPPRASRRRPLRAGRSFW